jgi:UDP-N-acetylglucosamine acyltransferase
MATYISPLAYVDPRAQLGEDVYIGPFCFIGPDVRLGANCRLESHVTIIGWTTIGERNRFLQNCVIGGEPQDKSYVQGAPTQVIIGDDNQFREGVTVNRGAEKEDGVTRIDHRNLLMSNAHVAHNCHVFSDTMLVNGVLLGGHVHVHDRAIISGNSGVVHFCSIGTLAFVGGCSKVVADVPPYMMFDGNDDARIKTLNLVGMQRAGISVHAIASIKRAYKLLIREHQPMDEVRNLMSEELNGVIPLELGELFRFLDYQRQGKMGRGREAVRAMTTNLALHESSAAQSKAA